MVQKSDRNSGSKHAADVVGGCLPWAKGWRTRSKKVNASVSGGDDLSKTAIASASTLDTVVERGTSSVVVQVLSNDYSDS